MKYTKSVIALVFEIRKKVASQYRDEIKLTNPQLDIELVGLYKVSDDVIVQALIKEVLLQMESKALQMIAPQEESPKGNKRENTLAKKFKMYRGKKVEQDESPDEDNSPPTLCDLAPRDEPLEVKKKEKRKRVYRGRVMED